jgi:HAMP domain-containing protein
MPDERLLVAEMRAVLANIDWIRILPSPKREDLSPSIITRLVLVARELIERADEINHMAEALRALERRVQRLDGETPPS